MSREQKSGDSWGTDAFADILPVIHEHHGPLSCDPPYQRLIVYGARYNETARQALEEIGFALEAVTHRPSHSEEADLDRPPRTTVTSETPTQTASPPQNRRWCSASCPE